MAKASLLKGATVYLSGPMDFVASRAEEQRNGWRARIAAVLKAYGVRVFDPWYKPEVRGLGRYGIEDATSTQARDRWVFERGQKAAQVRASLASDFWPIMHIDLRMVDLCDFVIACTPTNLYSVGTPHEIVLARQQRKPVLLVSPPVRYPKWDELQRRIAEMDARDGASGDGSLTALLDDIKREVVVRDNQKGTPSQWYMTLVDSESFYDGFGWSRYRAKHRVTWPANHLDDREERPNTPTRPLLEELERLDDGRLPRRWNRQTKKFQTNDDWLLLSQVAASRPRTARRGHRRRP